MTRNLSLLAVAALAACATSKSATTAPAAGAHHEMAAPAPADAGGTKAFDHKPAAGEVAICAVSGEKFTVSAETKVREYKGKWYALCCDDCGPEFDKEPEKFATP